MTAQTLGAAGTCPFTVDRPVMRQRWERLTFLHWPFEAADVQRLLPAGLLILEGVAGLLRAPLSVGRGGIREGVLLEAMKT